MTLDRCAQEAAVDAHFDAGLAPDEEHALRLHLPTCARCTRRYERHLALEAITPGALGAKERLRRGLPLPPATVQTGEAVPLAPRRRRWLGPAAGVLALAAAMLLFLRRPPPGDDAFHARGGAEPSASSSPRLELYRLEGPRSSVVAGSIGRDDELAFAYANPAGKRRLLVFGVDEHRHVYWYHPAWTRPEDNPSAVSILARSDLVELKEGVSHAYDGRQLRVYGLFTDEALTTRDVEARIAAEPALTPRLYATR